MPFLLNTLSTDIVPVDYTVYFELYIDLLGNLKDGMSILICINSFVIALLFVLIWSVLWR